MDLWAAFGKFVLVAAPLVTIAIAFWKSSSNYSKLVTTVDSLKIDMSKLEKKVEEITDCSNKLTNEMTKLVIELKSLIEKLDKAEKSSPILERRVNNLDKKVAIILDRLKNSHPSVRHTEGEYDDEDSSESDS